MEMKTLTVNGQTYTVADPDAAHIDDSAVSDKAWSGKNIIDRLCPAFAVSGAEVACQPVADYPLEVVSQIAATQDGVAQVTLHRSGKNLFDPAKVQSSLYILDNNGDGSFYVRTDGGTAAGANTLRDFAPGLQVGQTYTLSAQTTGDKKYWYFTGKANQSWVFGTAKVITEELLDTPVLWYKSSDGAKTIVSNIQIEAGSVATAYEPYYSEELAADFGKTVYSGSYNWRTGELTDENGQLTQLQPRQVLALPGVNILHSDTGDTAVAGRADPTAAIEKLTNAITALGGNI